MEAPGLAVFAANDEWRGFTFLCSKERKSRIPFVLLSTVPEASLITDPVQGVVPFIGGTLTLTYIEQPNPSRRPSIFMFTGSE